MDTETARGLIQTTPWRSRQWRGSALFKLDCSSVRRQKLREGLFEPAKVSQNDSAVIVSQS
eukprot:12398049-Karenia_brevis.AAC.1